MKKPKQIVDLVCAHCEVKFTQSVGELSTRRKKGQKRFFCTPACCYEASKKGRVCSVQGCSRRHRRNGFCEMHSQRVVMHGDPNRGLKPMRQRILERIQVDGNGCWNWRGRKTKRGYGFLTLVVAGHLKCLFAHRVAYETHRGPIPAGLTIDHLCRNRACVNPDHLEPVTAVENAARGKAARTSCRRGHPYAKGEFYLWRGTRICRACQRVVKQEQRAVL